MRDTIFLERDAGTTNEQATVHQERSLSMGIWGMNQIIGNDVHQLLDYALFGRDGCYYWNRGIRRDGRLSTQPPDFEESVQCIGRAANSMPV